MWMAMAGGEMRSEFEPWNVSVIIKKTVERCVQAQCML